MKFATEKEREQFILANINLAYKVATKIYYQDTCFTFEDVKQECCLRLIEAVDNYTKGKCNFSTYAYFYIYYKVIYVVSRKGYEYYYSGKFINEEENRGYSSIPLSHLLTAEGEQLTYDFFIDTTTLDFVENIEAKEVIDFALKQVRLDNRQIDMLKLFLQGYTQVDIGRIYSISRERVRQILKKTFNTLLPEVKKKTMV